MVQFADDQYLFGLVFSFFSYQHVDHSIRPLQSLVRFPVVLCRRPHNLLEALQISRIRFFAQSHAFGHKGLANNCGLGILLDGGVQFWILV